MLLNIHNQITVKLESPPDRIQDWYQQELPLFLEPTDKQPNIIVRFSKLEIPTRALLMSSALAVHEGQSYILDNRGKVVRFSFADLDSGRVEITADPDISTTFLTVQIIEPIVKSLILDQGSVFIHSSSAVIHEQGVLFSAWAHTGKTNVILGLLKRGACYLSDDWTIANNSTRFAYPKSLNLFSYNFVHYPELRKNIPGKLKFLFGVSSMIIAMLKPFCRGHSLLSHYANAVRETLDAKAHVRIPLNRAYPDIKMPAQASLTKLFLVQRHQEKKVVFEPLSPEDYAARMSACLKYERRDFEGWYSMSKFADKNIYSEFVESLDKKEQDLLVQIASQHPPMKFLLPDLSPMKEVVDQVEALISK